MATVELDGVTKVFDGAERPAVSGLDLSIDDGEFVVLVGPSGCGKSTALRMVAGLETVSGGEIEIAGRPVSGVDPQDRDIAMVFQNYALYPHMTVGKNLSYPLRVAGISKEEIEERVTQTAKILQLDELLERRPRQLSGGQRQRVAMGRALIRQPSVFLMDEPLSNLDAKLRVYMRSEISRIQGELGVTTLYVTHDQIEAMTMGDRVVVLKDGELQQVDTPSELYANPANLFVAGFIGSPAMNVFMTTLTRNGDGATLAVGEQTVDLSPEFLSRRPELAPYDGTRLVLGVRPDDVHDQESMPADAARLSADVVLAESLGSEVICHMQLGAEQVETGDPDLDTLTEAGGEGAVARADLLGRFTPATTASRGDRVDVGLDLSKLHFFDPETGAVIRG